MPMLMLVLRLDEVKASWFSAHYTILSRSKSAMFTSPNPRRSCDGGMCEILVVSPGS
jgi:hypothetical protein